MAHYTLADLEQLPIEQIQINTIIESDDLRTRYPTLDRTNIGRLRDALAVGATLPPIAVQVGTRKLIYGWHRLYAYREELGAEATIPARMLDVSDSEAIRLALAENSRHGLPLRAVDLQQAAIVAERFGFTDAEIVQLMHVLPGRLADLRALQGHFHRGPAADEPRYAYSRRGAASGLDALQARSQPPAAATAPAAPAATGPAVVPPAPAIGPAPDPADSGLYHRVGGRFPTPAWLVPFMSRPLAELGIPEQVTATPVVLKRNLRHLRGRELTEAQVRAARFVSGTPALSLTRQLVVLAYADALDLGSARLCGALRDLRRALSVLDLSEEEHRGPANATPAPAQPAA